MDPSDDRQLPSRAPEPKLWTPSISSSSSKRTSGMTGRSAVHWQDWLGSFWSKACSARQTTASPFKNIPQRPQQSVSRDKSGIESSGIIERSAVVEVVGVRGQGVTSWRRGWPTGPTLHPPHPPKFLHITIEDYKHPRGHETSSSRK